MKIAIVGATGMVGTEMLEVLSEMDIQCSEIILAASAKSKGKKVMFGNQELEVTDIPGALERRPHIAVFSAGGSTSGQWAQAFADRGCFVVDNSSYWRMKENIPLVVPEINATQLQPADKIIANPNCSTIQMVAALAPLHKAFGLKRVVCSTYQSVTGSGVKGVGQLMNEREGKQGDKAYPHAIDLNVIPHGGDFMENDYTSEEMKLVDESQKILQAPGLSVSATVVRVPVCGGHSIAVNAEFENNFEMQQVKELLQNTPGIIVQDNPAENQYPMPLHARGFNEVFVGRLRKDLFQPNTLNFWVVADNLRKGAATNALQIAKYLIDNNLVG